MIFQYSGQLFTGASIMMLACKLENASLRIVRVYFASPKRQLKKLNLLGQSFREKSKDIS